ncbi:Ribokinase-like protein [Pelagophyceae sp. CCMP2097]|nr:Ribokinase-like protein [Pelagophyceae sp. CCMP2097]
MRGAPSAVIALWLSAMASPLNALAPGPAGGVVVCGSSNQDLIASGPRLPRAGETLMHSSFQECFGGKGANQAVQAARLGARVEFIGKVGRDAFGAGMRGNFVANGVGSVHVTECDGVSGVALIAVGALERTNTVIVVPGANFQLAPADVDAAAGAFFGAAVLLCQLEVPAAATLRALEVANETPGCVSVLNTAPVPPEGVDDALLRAAAVVCPNEVELELLTGVRTDTLAGAAAGVMALQARGAKTVLATLGSNGALLVTPAGLQVYVPARKVIDAIDTTGAGDSFLGGFAAFLARGASTLEAVRAATYVAARSVQRSGTQPSYPMLKDLAEIDALPPIVEPVPEPGVIFQLQADGSCTAPAGFPR